MALSVRPKFNTWNSQEQAQRTLESQFGFGQAVAENSVAGFLSSFGAGTLVREAMTPQPNTPITDEAPFLSELPRAIGDIGAMFRGDKPEPTITPEEFAASPDFRKAIPYEEGMTKGRLAALSAQYDVAEARAMMSQKEWGGAFIGQFLGQMLDPINYVPFTGQATQAAAVARAGGILGRIGVSAVDAAISTAVFGVATAQWRKTFGDNISFEAMAQEVIMSAVIGGAFGAGVGVLSIPGDRRAREQRILNSSRAVAQADSLRDVMGRAAILKDGTGRVAAGLDGMTPGARTEFERQVAKFQENIRIQEERDIGRAVEARTITQRAEIEEARAELATIPAESPRAVELSQRVVELETYVQQTDVIYRANRELVARGIANEPGGAAAARALPPVAEGMTRIYSATDPASGAVAASGEAPAGDGWYADVPTERAAEALRPPADRAAAAQVEGANVQPMAWQQIPKPEAPPVSPFRRLLINRFMEAGRPGEEGLKLAQIYESAYANLSSRAGWTPEKMLQEYPLPEVAYSAPDASPGTLYQGPADRAFLDGLTPRERGNVNPIYTGEVPAKRLKGNEEAARWLEGHFNGDPISDFTKEISDGVLREIGNIMAAEAIYALRKTNSAFDWYTEAMAAAMRIASVKWPVLADDAAAAEAGFGTASNARFSFTYIMAVTSQNLDVAANAGATNKAFDEMLARVKAGDFTMAKEWGTGDKRKAMAKNFAKFGPLVESMEGETFPEKLANLDTLFRQSMPVSEWVKEMKAARIPFNPPGQTAMDAVVYGSSLLGPKIGNGFWQNLNGNYNPLTIDLWMRRTWGRLTGKSIGNASALPAQRRRLKASIARSINSPEWDVDPLLETVTEKRGVLAKIAEIEAGTDLKKKDKASQIRALKARVVQLDDIAADYRAIPAPEDWKPAYDTDDAQLAAYAKRLLAVWNKQYKVLRERYGEKVPDGLQPTWARAAKRLKADLTTPLDQVANGTQRKQIEKAARYAQAKLKELGYNVKTADLQAILWYPEKELWGALTSKLGLDSEGLPVIPPSPLNESYDTVFKRILDAEGYDTGAQQGTAGDAGGRTDGGSLAGRDAAGSGPDGQAGAGVPAADSSPASPGTRSAVEAAARRYVAGLSIEQSKANQGVDFKPGDADMAALQARIQARVGAGGEVRASKVLSTEGRYGDPERSVDLEVLADANYDPTPLWKHLVAESALAKQDAVFLAREIEALDEVDPTRHTPGVELLFDAPVSGAELEARLAELAKYDVKFLTVMVGGEPKTPGAMSDAIGIRMLHMPEFERRYGGDDDLMAMDDAALGDYIEARARAMTEQVHEVISNIPGMTGRVGWFDTNTAFGADYGRVLGDGSDVQPAGMAEDGASAAGGEVWRGQQVRERLAAADRHVAYLAQREADAGGGDAGPADDTFNQGGRRAGGYSLGKLAPLEGAPNVEGASGPDLNLIPVAEQYARDNGIDLRRQSEFVEVDPDRAARIAAAYDAMPHAPDDPKVKAAYQELIRQTVDQYRALEAAGFKFWLFDGATDPYGGNPWNAMRDLRKNKSMGVYATADGFGSGATELDVSQNPLLADTGIRWPAGAPDGPLQPVLANDLFRAVHDAFGHGIEGAGFRARGEENAWQAHSRLFYGDALGAITSETRGQNSWLNYGPYGEKNRTARVEDTVFADQKTGLMPEWTWREGRAGDAPDNPNQSVGARRYPVAPRDEWYGEANYEEAGGRLTEMSPDEYLARARPLKIDEVARDNIDDLKRHIEAGRTLDPLKFFDGGKEDGRHRAIAAKELGIARVPVIEFGDQIGRSADTGRASDELIFQQAGSRVLQRTPELQDAARAVAAGEMTPEAYTALVERYKPVTPYADVPEPASVEDMQRALTSDKVGRIGATDQLEAGHKVGLRLDIPAYANNGVWVVSVHEQQAGFSAGPSIGYTSVARASNVTMGVVEKAALAIAQGKPKGTIATIKGDWVPSSPEEAKAAAAAALADPAWRQAGMDPERASFFYDRETMQPITAAEEVIQIGPLVLAKNPTYADTGSFLYQPAYHGSPKVFDRFKWSDETRGTGEGAQAFGDGLYFAGKKEVAQHYRDMLAKPYLRTSDGMDLAKQYGDDIQGIFERSGGDPDDLRDTVVRLRTLVEKNLREAGVESVDDLPPSDYEGDFPSTVRQFSDRADRLEKLINSGDVQLANPGRLYKVDIPDDDELLAWDKPLSEQSPAILNRMAEALRNAPQGALEDFGAETPTDLARTIIGDGAITGQNLYDSLVDVYGSAAEASKALRDAGIPGHRFLDQGSRDAGEGTYNYVIYDDSRVDIIDYEQEVRNDASIWEADTGKSEEPRGQIQFKDGKSLMKLFDGADSSTALHESGHHFLMMIKSMAERTDTGPGIKEDWAQVKGWLAVNAKDVARESGANVSPDDVLAVLNRNTSGDRMKDIAINRGIHEQWARGFELYLLEGKAPSTGMRGVFESFKKWLGAIYASAKSLNVNLTPEIRQVFDRLLTDEATPERSVVTAPDRPAGAPTLDPPEPEPADGMLMAAASRAGKSEDVAGFEEQIGAKMDGTYNEEGDLDMLRSLGRVLPEEETALKQADDGYADAVAYEKAIKVALACVIP